MLGAFAISTIAFGVSLVQPPTCPFSSTPIAVATLVSQRLRAEQPHRGEAAAARSARTARRLAIDSEREVAAASSPRPIDIVVRISLYERTGSRPTAPKNPVSSSVLWPVSCCSR
jgi:hypothetical protein